MSRTLLIGSGAEVALNSATTLDNATVVRVINLSGVMLQLVLLKAQPLVMQALLL